MLCRKLGIDKPLVPIPLSVCSALAFLLGLFQKQPLLKRDTILGLTMDADISIEEARRDLGYDPKSFPEAIKDLPL